MEVDYSRFDIVRRKFLRDRHWQAISVELERLNRSLLADDGGQAIGDAKCFVESIARVVLDIDGAPAGPSDSYGSVVSLAHSRLVDQKGYEIATQSQFKNVATQSRKIVQNLDTIRNEYGGGHGRSKVPPLEDEMVALTLDAAFIWARWALRRVGYFSEGRPNSIIDALVGEPPQTFRSGDLRRRLRAADLPALEERHQRSIGIAVGQRVMRETFVVRWDGLDPCLQDDRLREWPAPYRLGLAHGLWFDVNDKPTLTAGSVVNALKVLEPVPDASTDLTSWVSRIASSRPAGGVEDGDWVKSYDLARFVREYLLRRPASELSALKSLEENITPEMPF